MQINLSILTRNHKVNIASNIKTFTLYVIAGVTIVPIRFSIFIPLMLTQLILARIGSIGLKPNPEISIVQNSFWRKMIVSSISLLQWLQAKLCYGIISSYSGTPDKQAKMSICAPHRCEFGDMTHAFKNPRSVAIGADHYLKNPVTRSFALLYEFHCVDRNSKTASDDARVALKKRINWPGGLFMMPEGTHSSGERLAHFKSGAFLPAVPVQPIVTRIHPFFKSLENIQNPTGFKLPKQDLWTLFFYFAHPYNRIDVHYMDTYVPNENEKKDPELYAFNVQKYVAECLGMEPTDYTHMDRQCISLAVHHHHYNHKCGLIGVEKIYRDLNETVERGHIIEQIFPEFLRLCDLKYGRSKMEIRVDMLYSAQILVSAIATICNLQNFFFKNIE